MLVPKRLEYAKRLGATRVINGKEKDAVKEILDMTCGAGVEKILETAGSLQTDTLGRLWQRRRG